MTRLRKSGLVLLVAIVPLLLGACAAPAAQPDSAARPLQETVGEALEGYTGLVPVELSDLAGLTGLDETMIGDWVYLVSADGLSAEEVIALRCVDESRVPAVKERLEIYLEQRLRETRNYLPDAYACLQQAAVQTEGRLVLLVTGSRAEAWAETILAGE